MPAEPLITTYLEMRSRDQLRPKRADARFQVREKRDRDWRFNRDLYFRVGEQWDWIDKRPWTDEQWKEYATAASCAPLPDIMMTCSPVIMNCVGTADGGIEIAYFGLLPELIGRGLGGALLTSAIEEAWARRGGSLIHPRVGAYVQPRSSAGARELSGARDDRLQGRGRALGGAFSLGKLSASPTKRASKAGFAGPGCRDSRRNQKNFKFF